MEKINPFPRKNIPAYMAVMGAMLLVSIVLWAVYIYIKTGVISLSQFSTYATELLFSIMMVMSGMMIMFIASLLNLRKMKKGWEAMAEGKREVKIPEVWCPVLTSAKEAAEKFIQTK
ncbi:hypothetical protein BC349_05535 [Flavihumibacter stibioxidans]|uniref:Uncharacterized protein n=3 Tax=Flavihumibacter stibioxidans TaxID=1834163 RepID=A0ABR7M716_9BACT|nr:hypothetical protein [Flavihumibacter stibioxidans]